MAKRAYESEKRREQSEQTRRSIVRSDTWSAFAISPFGPGAPRRAARGAFVVMAILGLLSLSGLLIKNAIVLVDEMDLRIKEGQARFDAIVDAAASRTRPVLMGALTTVLGVLPLMGDAFFRAMAVVLVFGLSFATVLTLFVVPVFYALIFGVKSEERAS